MNAYLDHNATSPIRPEAAEAMRAALEAGGNPSSVHAAGRAARATVERARAAVARFVNARTEDVIFTAGGTEADNLAVHSAKAAGARRIAVSAIEHEAVAEAAAASRLEVIVWPVTAAGTVDLNWLDSHLKTKSEGAGTKTLFALMAANNETGVIQPIADAGRMICEAGGLFLVDAVQMPGKAAFNFADAGAHYAALSAHKVGGPLGAGALVASPDAPVTRLIHGGGQEKNRRSGTENGPAIAGFAAALDTAASDEDLFARQRALRDRIETRLRASAPDIAIWGADAERLPNTICLSAPGWPSEVQVIAMDLNGFAVSAGAACSSGKVRRSRALDAMGAGAGHAEAALRVSVGWNTTQTQADAFADAWLNEYERARPKARAAV